MNYKVLLIVPVVALTYAISEYKSVKAAEALASKTSVIREVSSTPVEKPQVPLPTPVPSVTPLASRVIAPPTPPPAPTYSVGVEQWRPLVASIWPPGEVNNALTTILHESGGDPNIVSATNDYGLMQINNERIFDPAANIKRGLEKWQSAKSYKPWYAVCKPIFDSQGRIVGQYAAYPGIYCR